MRISFYFALLFAFSLAACQQGGEKLMTESGYEYIKHTGLEGETPEPGEYVYFHAQMRNGDSVVYSSRMQGAAPFLQIPTLDNPNRRPSPIEDVLQNMTVGDSVTVLIELDTLPTKPRGFENASLMYYDVAMVDIKSAEEYQEEAQKAQEEQAQKAVEAQARLGDVEAMVRETLSKYKEGELTDELQETDSGLKYIIHEEGTGKQAEAGKLVTVHYYGVLMDGTMFDNSFQRGQAISFPLGQGRVIPGWDEGIALLKEGAKATLFIPYELAYGEQGSPPTIPPKSELAFYVELAEVK